MCTEANTRLSSAATLSGGRSHQEAGKLHARSCHPQGQPGTSGRAVTKNVNPNIARATWRSARLSSWPKSRLGKRREEAHACVRKFMTLSRPAMFDTRQRSPQDPRQEVDKAVQHPRSCTSIAQDLTTRKQVTRKQVWQPSCTSRSSFRQVATLGSHHGKIPTWRHLRSR